MQAVKEGRLFIRQKPGPSNALGLVKFLFPNQEAVYLHDTPEDHLFERTRRTFSHGCMRVERPAEMAEWVLGPQGWGGEKVKEALRSTPNRVVNLEKTLPVRVTYFTAFPADGPDGGIRFYADVYDWDDLGPMKEKGGENLSAAGGTEG